jgi:hypothetical protein
MNGADSQAPGCPFPLQQNGRCWLERFEVFDSRNLHRLRCRHSTFRHEAATLTNMRYRATWLRFSLRTLFVAVAICSLLLAWQMKSVRDRRAMRVDIMRRGGLIGSSTNAGGPFSAPRAAWRELLGDQPVASINLHPDTFTEKDYEEIRRMFPEAELTQRNIFDGRGGSTPEPIRRR